MKASFRVILGVCYWMVLTCGDVEAGEKRMWTSADGKATFEGELVEFTTAEVEIKRAKDFQVFKLPLDKLSAADQTVVRGLLRGGGAQGHADLGVPRGSR